MNDYSVCGTSFWPIKLDPATFIEIIGIGIECFLVME